MRKIVQTNQVQPRDEAEVGWIDLEQLATVEVTSEDASFPIESALTPSNGLGWRAAQAGKQQIRILFDEPVALRRIEVRFHEAECERIQEFTLRWWSTSSVSGEELIRQQWNFNPAGAITEVENYHVNLDNVSVFELAIHPDISGRHVHASLASLRLA